MRSTKSGGRDARDLRRAFCKELRRALRRAARHPGRRDVHAVRKGITKLRSWLRLARDPIGSRRYRTHNRRLRKAARVLAPIRDARVRLAAFAAISSGSSFPNTSKYLHKQARRTKKALAAAMRKVKRRLEQECDASDRLPLEKITRTGFTAALERMRGEMAAASAAARAAGSTGALHKWRKRTKNYLHALAFIEGEKNRRHQSAARTNDLLGQDHDLALLETELAARSDEPESSALLALIAVRRAKLRPQLFPDDGVNIRSTPGAKPEAEAGADIPAAIKKCRA